MLRSNGGKAEAVRARILGLVTTAAEGDRVPPERERMHMRFDPELGALREVGPSHGRRAACRGRRSG